ncbi:MAG: ribosome biogenesis GTP-binding protein YihA/YsxC [Flavobacteriales bacterium]
MIISAEFVKSSTDWSKCPNPTFPEVAFIGRSNVGKSSLINRLVNKKGLAKTSGRPGKTQTINHFIINAAKRPWYLVDLPGYGYAKVSKSSRETWQEFIVDYLEKRENLYCTFILIDSRHTPQKIDIDFIVQMGEWEIPFALVFTKADKMKPGGLENNLNVYKEKLLEYFVALPNIFVTSADNGMGKDDLLKFVEELVKQPLSHDRS